jgi:hypothetical protein
MLSEPQLEKGLISERAHVHGMVYEWYVESISTGSILRSLFVVELTDEVQVKFDGGLRVCVSSGSLVEDGERLLKSVIVV